MAQAIFFNKDKSLTDYALSCGYVEKADSNDVIVELYKESNCFHVRGYDFNNSTRVFWDSYDSLTKARKGFYRALKQTLKTSKAQYLASKGIDV